MTVLRTAAPVLRRLSFTFSPDGSHAACLAAGSDGGWYPESWRLDGPGPAHPTALPLPGDRAESLYARPHSLPDGRVLLCRSAGERHELLLRGPHPAAAEPDPVTLRSPALCLLPLPSPAAGRGPVAVALGVDTRPVTTLWLVPGDGGTPEAVAEFPGAFGGGVWLDGDGRLLALDRVRAGVLKTVVLDLQLLTLTPLLEITADSNDRLLLVDPATGLLLLRSDAPGTDRLGWGVLGSAEPVRFPDCLDVPGLLLRPVALDPAARTAAGSRVAIQLDHGASSALALWRPDGGRLEPLPVPPGRLGGVGHWSAAGLRMPYSAPDRPAGVVTLEVDVLLGAAGRPPVGAPLPLRLAPLGGPRLPTGLPRGEPWPPAPGRGWRLDGSPARPDGGRWHPAQTLELAGPAGPIEAVVYGGEAWLSSEHLVIALHGGPADAWRLEFDPALQRMADAGLAVLAPNQRGSTGYGPAHAAAIHGAWGGPDLADLLALLAGLAGQRSALGLEPPALLGISYGAFLALLTAAHAPAGQVSRCAAVAPFLSGARLLADGTPTVRTLTGRLGGATPVDDELGPRDVLRLAHLLRAPLLLLHGDRDEVVPIGQSRLLRQELLRIGRVEGADFRYVEAAGAGHDLLAEEGAAVLHELLAGFLRTGRAGG
ncbi:alpha/beta hydrolase family protein [Kitasatospora sp. NPDC052896]|uniref:alpha/beta hydrolase family protein n=1 Tax=Kitasatospora sp. NPDC052896 TaxID=3364061 RepID=UPI0037C92ECA